MAVMRLAAPPPSRAILRYIERNLSIVKHIVQTAQTWQLRRPSSAAGNQGIRASVAIGYLYYYLCCYEAFWAFELNVLGVQLQQK